MPNTNLLLPSILLLVLAAAPRGALCDITSDLKAYWTFDHGVDQIVLDWSDSGAYDGMLGADLAVDSDDPTWVGHGAMGSALSFDGVDDYVSIPYIYDVGSSKITVSAMVKQTDTAGYQYFMSNKNDFNDNFIRIGFDLDNGKLRVYTEQDKDYNKKYISGQSYTGMWHHVVVTRDGSTGVLYVDGQHVADFEAAGGDIGTNSVWFVGQSGAGEDFFQGYLDEVRVYDRDLSAQDVAELFDALPVMVGDANGDGAIDLQDFSLLKANFGGAGTWAQGDFNGDGAIDLQDFSLLKANFGAGGSPVPEPTTLGVVAICSASLIRRRQR